MSRKSAVVRKNERLELPQASTDLEDQALLQSKLKTRPGLIELCAVLLLSYVHRLLFDMSDDRIQVLPELLRPRTLDKLRRLLGLDNKCI